MVQVDDVLPPRQAWRNHHYNIDEETPTIDEYVTILKFNSATARALFILSNTGESDLLYSIYGSITDAQKPPADNDPSWYPTVKDKTLTAGQMKDESFFYSWGFMMVQVKSAKVGQPTTFQIWEKGD